MKIPIEFVSEGDRIQGQFYRATGEPPFSTVLLLHGLPGDVEDVLGLGQRMPQSGINVLTFNYRGTHRSEGAYSGHDTLADIWAAERYLRQAETMDRFQIDADNIVLGGWSYGGGMALAYAASHADVRRVFSIAGTDHGEFARQYQRNPAFAEMVDAMFDAIMSPTGPVRSLRRTVIAELLQNPAPYDLRLNAKALADRDILLIGGWDDRIVTIEQHILPLYRALAAAEAREVKIVAFQDDHDFVTSRAELAETIVHWVQSS